jgi:type I restriction enzyme S subunit
MNNSYPYVKLKELCAVSQGLQIPIEDRFTENAPNRYFYITVQFLKTSHTNKFYVENPPSSSICNEEDILIVRTGSTGQIVTGVSGCFHNNFFKIKFNKELIHGRYLYHCLNTKEKYRDMLRRAGVTTIPDLNHFMFLDMEIPLPEKNIQIQIAKNLDLLDSKIELNNRINAELEAMAKTLYDYWFVQFDFPNATGKPYKTSGGKMCWNEELKREIPEGWEIKKVKEFASTGSGSTPLKSKKEYYLDGNVPWINSGEVNNPFIIEAKKYITQLGLNSASTKLFKKGTLLIAMYGATAGKVSILDIEACTNQAICSINVNNNSHRNYLKFVLDDLYEYLINLSTGSARDNLSQDKIKELIVLMPDDLSIQKFDKLIESSYDKILNAYRENQKLTELRDWLLPMLMNGQVKVS